MLWQLVIVLISTAQAAVGNYHLNRQDVTSIQHALNIINEGIRRTDIATIGLQNGTGPALATLESHARALLTNATAVIAASAPLDLQDSLSLTVATRALRSNFNLSLNDLIAQKPLLDAAGQSQQLLSAIMEEKNLGLAMANTLISKLDPGAGQPLSALSELTGAL